MTHLPIESPAAATSGRAVSSCNWVANQDLRTGLLVSVRSFEELTDIADLGVDVIDFKEPQKGPLAAADPLLWARAARVVSATQKLSAALGECDEAVLLASSVPDRFAYAKAGPAGVDSIEKLLHYWDRLQKCLPASVELVAVAYADNDVANCPDPESIFDAAGKFGMKTWLLDTFGKSPGNGVVQRIGVERLGEFRVMADSQAAKWVLAGSIRIDDAIWLKSRSISPDLFGVRGDVCDTSRTGNVVAQKISRWLELVRTFTDAHHHSDNRDRPQS
jgi:uncharacterized protein (UPF0264 family)